jgi:hypothetical protein
VDVGVTVGAMYMYKGDLADVYRSCMRSINNAEYCAGVVDAVVDAASRWIYTYASEGDSKPRFRFHIIRTHSNYEVKIYVDAMKESLILVLNGLGHSIHLYYERRDGRFVLKRGGIVSLETIALMNGYFEPPLDALKNRGGEQ